MDKGMSAIRMRIFVGRRSEVGRRMKMRKRDLGRVPTLLIWAFLSFYPCNAFADSPTIQIKSTVDQVIQILTNPQLQGGRKSKNVEKGSAKRSLSASISKRWLNVR